ncbi:unnamed protein product [Paramecium primaurelia]|uniref:Cyclic nucleotide-binding domain-containing protein n=1 Tax=Paramecium primaurelia TaxID=5886 RepID=A0A8S1N123_PARPR|nr:unnamed protein product [Paramecium primaurelia]
MSLSDLLDDHGDSANSQFGINPPSYNEEQVRQQFRGPAKLATKIDPLQEVGDYSIKPPSNISLPKATDQINPSQSPNSGPFQFTPKTSLLEEKILGSATNKEQIRDLAQSNYTNIPKEGVNNFLKLVIAKSRYHHFIDLLVQRAYVKKLSEFNIYQNTMLDDLRYIDSKYHVHKNLIGKFCKKLRFVPILDQSSYMVIGWQLLYILTIIIIFFWTPFNLSFGITLNQVIFGSMMVKEVEFYFLFSIIIDGFIVINTSYIRKGIIIKSRGKIFINYLNTQAIYDLCSIVSMLIAQYSNVDSGQEHLGWELIPYAVYYCSRIFKLQGRVHKLEEFFNFSGWVQDVIELIKLLFMVIYVGHLFACLWHSVAFYQIGYNKTWLEIYDIVDANIFTKYNYAFYWAVQTMITVGYGDLTPQNDYERLCANLSMFLACGVFAFSFNSIGLMLSNLNSRQVLYKRSTNLLNQFLTKNQIKVELQSRIRNYYDYIFQEEQEINDEEVSQITTKLSSSLQEELNFEIRLNVMKTNKVLTRFSQKTLRELSLLIEEVRFSPEDQIIQQGTQDDCSLYLITKGTVSILFQNELQAKNIRVLQYLEKGQTFGEYSFFTGLNRTASAKSIGFSRAYKIARQKLLNVLQTNEIDLERFCEVRDQILQSENYQPAQLQCYSCNKSNHLIKDCPILHFVPDKEKVIKKEYFPIQQQRNVTYIRQRCDRNYYATLLEMKKTLEIIKEFQSNELYNDNQNIYEENSDVSYDDNDDYPYEYSSQNKSYSKISRQQSKNCSYSQNDNNHSNNPRNLQPIQESEDSDNSVSPIKQRNSAVKNTIQTAGFGGQDSFQNKIKLDDHDKDIINITNQAYPISNSYKEDHRIHQKNDRLLSPRDIPNRINKKRITAIQKQNREESYQPFSTQTQLDLNQEKEKSIKRKSKLRDTQGDIDLVSSVQSVEYKRDSIDIRDDKKELRRKTTKTKTNRSRTAKTRKTTKLMSENPSQEISIPMFEKQVVSMELEGFEKMKNYQFYYIWNNPKVVISRAIRILTKYLERKRNIVHSFSSYTFSAIAINQMIKIKKKLKLLDDPLTDEKKDKKIINTLNKTGKPRIGSKKSTYGQSDDISSLFQKKPLHTGQTSLSQRISMSKQIRTDL